jgi:hypothetical protein
MYAKNKKPMKKSKDDEYIYCCEGCGKEFSTHAGAAIHEKRWCSAKGIQDAGGLDVEDAMTDDEPASLICGHCNKHFDNLGEFKAHDIEPCARLHDERNGEKKQGHAGPLPPVKIEAGKGPGHECGACGARFKTILELLGHVRREHSVEPEKQQTPRCHLYQSSRCIHAQYGKAPPLVWCEINCGAHPDHWKNGPGVSTAQGNRVPMRERVIRCVYEKSIRLAIIEEAPSFDRDAIQDIIDKVEAMVDAVMKED